MIIHLNAKECKAMYGATWAKADRPRLQYARIHCPPNAEPCAEATNGHLLFRLPLWVAHGSIGPISGEDWKSRDVQPVDIHRDTLNGVKGKDRLRVNLGTGTVERVGPDTPYETPGIPVPPPMDPDRGSERTRDRRHRIMQQDPKHPVREGAICNYLSSRSVRSYPYMAVGQLRAYRRKDGVLVWKPEGLLHRPGPHVPVTWYRVGTKRCRDAQAVYADAPRPWDKVED